MSSARICDAAVVITSWPKWFVALRNIAVIMGISHLLFGFTARTTDETSASWLRAGHLGSPSCSFCTGGHTATCRLQGRASSTPTCLVLATCTNVRTGASLQSTRTVVPTVR
jgi:hypothetical protein